ncbi:L-seryl-tRNA(Sec) selenium transferase [candidate division WOR-3 bacterium]|nr:L-seryl-tRNA(Sec) selenium transferase [candidate division WOR-3 bacterium]
MKERDKKDSINKELRRLPSVERMLESSELQPDIDKFSRVLVTEAAQEVIRAIRDQLLQGDACPSRDEIIEKIKQYLAQEELVLLQPVINGTGVILHTNLGRAPLSQEVLASVVSSNQNYCNLEYDLSLGQRGIRAQGVEKLLCSLTRAESALVVNNNAGAVFLILTALAKGREVIISRGELIQIGGGFRIPEILEQSGAYLREVGTTNRTYLEDYESAINENTGLLLKVHQSNFRMRGFTHSVSISELTALGKRQGLPVVEDLGSGVLLPTEQFGLEHEPMVQEAVAEGIDVVCFSGDKLLGGAQAGVILGKRQYLDKIRKHPLLRALRMDKMTTIALQVTLLHYLKKEAIEKVPVWQMINYSIQEIAFRAEKISKRLTDLGVVSSTCDGFSTIGGGSLPDQTLPTKLIAIEPPYPVEDFIRRLRLTSPPLLGRIESDRFVIDPRTIMPSLDGTVIKIIQKVLI